MTANGIRCPSSSCAPRRDAQIASHFRRCKSGSNVNSTSGCGFSVAIGPGSAYAAFCSWSYIHNESVKIYSHLIPKFSSCLDRWYIRHYLDSKYCGVTDADFVAFSIFSLTGRTGCGDLHAE
ncbi:hypothetical protein M433DRAFT_9302 [Acidomyces richmondensis BFW]|nr:hypothetical protein M433DRAFT_9302 [Acidomyces richmondensis BFW]